MSRKENTRQWRIGDIGHIIKNCIVAIFQGKFLLKLKVDKYFLQIAYTFFLFTMLILFRFMVDMTLTKVEDNKKQLQELEILHTQKKYELVKLNRRSTVSKLLEDNGSKVAEPQKPAVKLK